MRTVQRKVSSPSQCSYDYENEDGSEKVVRSGLTADGSISQRSTIDNGVGDVYEDLFLLQEIAFDLPEIEGSLLSVISNVKHCNSYTFPAWFLKFFTASFHYLLIAGFVFIIGLIAGIFVSSPTGISGSFVWHSSAKAPSAPQSKLFVYHNAGTQSLSVEGTLYLSHHLLNPTPFTASFSSLVSVLYLPQDLSIVRGTDDCRNETVWKKIGNSGSTLLKFPNLKIFQGSSTVQNQRVFPGRSVSDVYGNLPAAGEAGARAVDEGNLVTVSDVKQVSKKDRGDDIQVADSSMFDLFRSYLMLGNRLHVVASVQWGLNEVSYMISVKQVLARNAGNSELFDSLLRDCRRGAILLQIASVDQRFETMFFGGDMPPHHFAPVSVTCKMPRPGTAGHDLRAAWRGQSDAFVKQFNILLNMDTVSDMRYPLRPSRTESNTA
ncbi:adenylate cyclase [Babesia ovata]|uniref:Adenylate cyclase n=1 Tax=Babesia ovata TaxID=189622 RepID=A0A2H6KD32_9APIC|nr:adenylate cyclase [Babesia ovata]GBE60906.1 adenylate cyclase [Babesia ovata]